MSTARSKNDLFINNIDKDFSVTMPYNQSGIKFQSLRSEALIYVRKKAGYSIIKSIIGIVGLRTDFSHNTFGEFYC